MTTVVQRSALLPYAASAVFDIVNDVCSYPEFLPFCSDAKIVDSTVSEIVASVSLRSSGLTETFVTRNVLNRPERIDLELVSGPFHSLLGHWSFTRLEDLGCKVELNLEFQLSGMRTVLGGVFAGVFTRVADQLVDAFAMRARQLLS